MSFQSLTNNLSVSDSGVLTASCQNPDGNWSESSFNLNTNLQNVDGALSWGNGGFADSSKDFHIVGSVLSAICRKTDGSWVLSAIDLSKFVTIRNGGFQLV